MTLYSKEAVTVPCAAMRKTGRFVHSFIITGSQGVGKRTAARYLAMSLLCSEGSSDAPCGTCRDCRRILKGQHPDFIEVEKNGSTFSTDDMREKVVADSFVTPNDCDRKVYLMADCDGWKDAAQDVLLKITEDPPDFGYFIFTAGSREVFLPTLISRSMVMELHEADREGCIAALREHGRELSANPGETAAQKPAAKSGRGSKRSEQQTAKDFTEENMAAAAELFGGNIGFALEYMQGSGKLARAAETAAAAARAAADRDEYALAAALTSVSGNRDDLRTVLEMLSRVIRDSAVIRSGSRDIIGCAPSDSRRIAERAGRAKLIEMYEAISDASYSCTRYCNAAAVIPVLAGKLS